MVIEWYGEEYRQGNKVFQGGCWNLKIIFYVMVQGGVLFNEQGVDLGLNGVGYKEY